MPDPKEKNKNKLDTRIEVADNPAVDIIRTGKRNASIRKGYEFSIFDIAEDLGLQFNPFEGEKA